MSAMQNFGIYVAHAVMLALAGVIAIFALIVLKTNVGFAWSYAGGIGIGVWLVIGAIAMEIAKNSLPILVYISRHDSPRMSEFVFRIFLILYVISWICSFWYANYGSEHGADIASNVLLMFGHFFAAGGPLVWYITSKWIEDRPTDGLPRAPIQIHPAPMQQEALPSPDAVGQGRTLADGFIEWALRTISRDPGGQVAPGKALGHYNAWASSNGYPTAEAGTFEPLMATAVEGLGGYASGGFYIGVSLASEPQYLAVH